MPSLIVCRTRTLTPSQRERAQRRAIEINPANSSDHRTLARTPVGRAGGRLRLVVVKGNRWPASGVRLSVKFLDNPPKDLRARILRHMNAWNRTANVAFTETRGTGHVRIARYDDPPEFAGYWSLLGTEILGAEDDEATLNLEGFTMRTTDAEFRRVVRHEAGHTLGFEHEHLRSDMVERIDRRAAYEYFDREEGWTRKDVDEQVLTPLKERSTMGTAESDATSIMCYHTPASIMKDGRAIRGGKDINKRDFAFAAAVYPKRVRQPARPR